MVRMLINFIGLVLYLTGIFGEQVPCSSGQTQCARTDSARVSYIGNDLYCCPRDFSIQWKSVVQTGTTRTDCVCERQYYAETDCYEGQAQCAGATNFAYDGAVVRCCRDGSAMSSSMTVVNGQMSGYCKCRPFANNSPGQFTGVQILSPNLENADPLQYWNQWLSTLQKQLQYQLNAIQSVLNPSVRNTGFGQWAIPMWDGASRGPNSGGFSTNGASGGANGGLQSSNSIANNESTNAQRLTERLPTDQRSPNRAQRQQRQNTRGLLDMLNPASWFNQNNNTSTNGNQISTNDSVNSPFPFGLSTS